MENSNAKLVKERDAIVANLPTRSPIYLPTEKVPLEAQIEGLKRVKRIYEKDLDALYRPRLRALKSSFSRKKRCFIIGNGPSLNKTDLSRLKNEVTFAVNGFFLKQPELDWTPTFYMVEDHLVAEDRADAINKLTGSIKLFPAYLGYCIDKKDDTIFFNHRPRVSYPDGFDFSTNAEDITYTGCTVTFTAMQMAASLGFEEIYLIGVDADYDIPSDAKNKSKYDTSVLDMKSDDPNHFHPDYFGKGYRWHDPQVDKMLEAYAEAKRVTDKAGIKIYNATIGGKLEVFPRRKYSELFEKRKTIPNVKSEDLPRILLIDLTKIGGGTATGELKAKYFAPWKPQNILHIFGNGREKLGQSSGGRYLPGQYDIDQVMKSAEKFAPDIILYRPVAENKTLHEFAMRAIAKLKVPHVVWLMDDWPERLLNEDAEYGQKIEHDLTNLCTHAVKCFAISGAMAGAFGARYGAKFEVFHNGVQAKTWEAIKPNRMRGTMRVCYAGGLAPDMALQNIRDITRAVAQLAESGVKIKMEILTQPHWIRESGRFFQSNRHVTLNPANLTAAQYRQWLADAGLLVIANNFDEKSATYVRYSFANKMPECLASGTPVLAYGPNGLATMDILSGIKGVTRVDTPNYEKLLATLKALAANTSKRNAKGKAAKAYALTRFKLADFVKSFKWHCKRAESAPFHPMAYTAAAKYSKTPSSKKSAVAISSRKHKTPATFTTPKPPKIFRSQKTATPSTRNAQPRDQFAFEPAAKRSFLSYFLKYILGWKGLIAALAGLGTVFGAYTLFGAQSPFEKAVAAFLIAGAQMVNFALIAHLAAHVNKRMDGH